MMITFGSEDIKTFFPVIIIEFIIIEEIIHIEKCILAHVANVPGCHPFRRILHIFFAQLFYIWLHDYTPTVFIECNTMEESMELCGGSFSTRAGHYFLVHFLKGNTCVPVIEFQEDHGCAAFTLQGVIAEGMKDGSTPLIETAEEMMLFTGDGTMEFFVDITVPGIEAAIPDHFKVFLRDMSD